MVGCSVATAGVILSGRDKQTDIETHTATMRHIQDVLPLPLPSYEFSDAKQFENVAGQSPGNEPLNECTGRLYYFRNVQNYLTFITIVALCLRQCQRLPIPSAFTPCLALLTIPPRCSSFVCILLIKDNNNYL